MISSFFNNFFHTRDDEILSIRFFSVIALVFVLYAIYYDLTFLKYKPDILWYTAKVFYVFAPIIVAFTSLVKRENRLFVIGFFWILYAAYHTYFVSLSYNIAFIQACIAFSVIVVFTRLQYTVFASFLFFASFITIMFAKHEMPYIANGFSEKPMVLINSISLQGLCYLVYYFVTLPKLKIIENDKQFADYGKTSSFLMHEMAKPLRKMNQNPECFQEELNRLNEIYSIASSLRNKENPQLVLEEVNVDKFVNEIVNKYESFI